MADDEITGRRAAYNSRGQQRGFRSRPGAPLADPTNSFPMSGDNSTPKSNWDAMFTNRLTGNNPLSPEARTPAGAPSAVDTAMNEILGFSFGSAPETPSLDILAAGGPTHAQAWGGDSLGKPQPPIPGKSFKNRYGTGSSSFSRELSAGYGWGSNSRAT